MAICWERSALWSSSVKELLRGHLLGKNCLMVICCERAASCPSAGKELPFDHLLGKSCLVPIYWEKNCLMISCWESKKVSNDRELIQSDPTSCFQNQKVFFFPSHLLWKSCFVAICWERTALWPSAVKELFRGHLLGKNCLMAICCERAASWPFAGKELPHGHLL